MAGHHDVSEPVSRPRIPSPHFGAEAEFLKGVDYRSRLANSSREGPEGKHLWLCGPDGL